MNHPTLKGYTFIDQLDYVDLYSNASSEILIARFKVSTVVTEEMAKESLNLVLRNIKANTTYGITDVSADSIDFTNEAKNYYRKNMDKEGVVLNAVVVKDITLKIIANTYARFDRPRIPTRVYTDIHDACSWIEDNRL